MTEHALFGDQKEVEYGCRAIQGRPGDELVRWCGESRISSGFPLGGERGVGLEWNFLEVSPAHLVVGRGTVWGAERKKTLLSSPLPSLMLLPEGWGSQLPLWRSAHSTLASQHGRASTLPAETVDASSARRAERSPGLQLPGPEVGGARGAARSPHAPLPGLGWQSIPSGGTDGIFLFAAAPSHRLHSRCGAHPRPPTPAVLDILIQLLAPVNGGIGMRSQRMLWGTRCLSCLPGYRDEAFWGSRLS